MTDLYSQNAKNETDRTVPSGVIFVMILSPYHHLLNK